MTTDTEYKCEFCNKIFSNNSNLKTHIKNAKYCIKLRDNFIPDNQFICNYCNKDFTSKQKLDYHLLNCNFKKDEDLKNLKLTIDERLKIQEENYKIIIKELEDKYEKKIKELVEQLKEKDERIERLATVAINRPTTQNNQRINNIINNLTPITEDYLKEQAEYLTLDHVKNGVDGYVQYALDYPLKDKIVCTDFSRKRIKYKDEEGNLIDDPEMLKLAQKLFKAIEDKNTILINEYIRELCENYNVLVMGPDTDMGEDEGDDYEAKLELLTNQLLEVKKQRKNITEIAKGDKNETYYDFMKDICLKTIK
jgi:hypothetical protein